MGLLRAAAFCGDPVAYCESKSRYRFRDEFMERKYPDLDFVLWPGTSRRYGDGKDLAIITVAEGIETVTERETLVDLGCDLLQGYLLAKPDRPFPSFTW